MSNQQRIDRRFVRVGNSLVHIRTAGDPSHPPLFMMHASPASSRTLEDLMLALCARHFVIAPDTFGNGDSDPLSQPKPEMANYAHGMEALCDALGLGPIDVYGTHTGAHIGIEWADFHPGRVRRLILDGVAIMDAAERSEFLKRYAPPKTPQPDGSQFHWAWHFMRDQMIFYPHYKKDLEHLRPGGTFDANILHQLTMDVLGSLETYHLTYEAVFRQNVLKRAGEVTQDVLLLTSAEGPLEDGMERLTSAFQHATTQQTDGTALDKFAAISAFLNDQDKGHKT